MGAGLTIEYSDDENAILRVLTHPDIWDAVSYDTVDPESATLEMGDNHYYTVIKKNGVIIGVSYFNFINPKMVEFHPSVLPEYRQELSYIAVKESINHIFSISDVEKITVQIPDLFGRVVWFAIRMGFKLEGKFTHAYPKNDEMIDINLLGLTRSEWADL